VYVAKIIRTAREADVVFAQDAMSVGLPVMLAMLIVGKPFVVRLGGIFSWEQGRQRFGVKDSLDEFVQNLRKYGLQVRMFTAIERFVCARAIKIIVPSEYLKSVLIRFGVSEEKIAVVYNTYDPVSIDSTKEEVRAKRNISGFTVVSAGRFVPWKGFRGVIKAVAGVREFVPDINLIIIGDGEERAALEGAAREEGIADRVRFTGVLPRAEAMEYIYAANAFVLNTGYEGFAHFVLEAAALHTPIITTDVPGNTEFLKDDESALLFSHNDIIALKDAILRIHKDQTLASRLTENAKEIPNQFSSERLLSSTEHIFRTVVA